MLRRVQTSKRSAFEISSLKVRRNISYATKPISLLVHLTIIRFLITSFIESSNKFVGILNTHINDLIIRILLKPRYHKNRLYLLFNLVGIRKLQ